MAGNVFPANGFDKFYRWLKSNDIRDVGSAGFKFKGNVVVSSTCKGYFADHFQIIAIDLEDEKLELAKKLEKTSQPAFLDTAGWVYYRKGDYDKALPILKRVVDEAPQVPVFQYHLGMTYFQKGDKAAAKEHLTLATAGDYSYQGIEEARATLESL